MTIHCPSCSRTLRLPEDLAGKTVRCPACQATFTAEPPRDEPPQEAIVLEPGAGPRPEAREADRFDYLPEYDEDRPLRRRASHREAQYAVNGPAVALIVTGSLALGLGVLSLFFQILLGAFEAGGGARRRPGAPPDPGAVVAYTASRVVGTVLGMAWGGTVLTGGIRMRNLSSHGWATAGCVVAIIPCNLCCLLGLPFGIWGLNVINRPEVKAAFG
jgi:hypothetical protein